MERELTETAFIGEKLLYKKIIERAALDIAQDLSSPRHWVDQQNAYAWVKSDIEHPTAFVVCCEICGYDPEKIREKILTKAIITQKAVSPETIRRRRRAERQRRAA